MSNALVLNALLLGVQRKRNYKKNDPVAELLHKLGRVVEKNDIFIVADDEILRIYGPLFNGFHHILPKDRKTKTVFSEIHKVLQNYDDVIYLFIDMPLVDAEITKKMVSLHREEIAEYTYGEGFPLGFAPEIIKVNLLPKLVSLLHNDDEDISRDSIFKAMSKEINSFDIETYFAPHDLKLRRIELTTSPKRNGLITERIIEREGVDCSYGRFCTLIHEQPEILRTVPSYVEVEITNRANYSCIYSPLPHLKRDIGQMSFDAYRVIFDKLRNFSENFHIAFSFLGEPLLHEDLKRFIKYTVDHRDVNLILESDGVLFTPDFSDYISALQAENLSVIFKVDAIKKETYTKIWGGDLGKVERNVRYLLSKSTGKTYVQMVRMDQNEQEMLEFYDTWEKEGARVIIQKYNSFLSLLPILTKADLRPLERQPCWHLLRDLVIFQNGDVPRCKQDINGDFKLGNLISDGIDHVWKNNTQDYLKHCAGEYDEYCRVCDEYYTFNF